jgi:crotonobetainyl-CoA:carnitine CoA-transferase CaiB-like acyl-CoA transferase
LSDTPGTQAVGRYLGDVRVLTFGSFVAGNTAAQILAELGMDVVKIESRVRPEALRIRYFPDHDDVFEPSGMPTTALYGGLARSVRSAAVELSTPEGAATFRRLAASADVVIENFRPHVMDQFGCGFDALHATNPRLSMLSISGYGGTGPRSRFAAYASNISNHVGLTAAWGHTHGYHYDYVAAYHGALAVLAALAHTDRTGVGLHLDLAQVEAAATMMAPLLLEHLVPPGRPAAPVGARTSAFAAVVACAGTDRWVAVDAVDRDDLVRLCDVVECPTPAPPGPVDRAALLAAVTTWARERTPHQAAHVLQRAGVAAAPVQNADDLFRDPQLRARGFIVDIEHRDLGRIAYPGAIERTLEPSGGVKGAVPRLGEHTRDVLGEWAGIGATELDALTAAGAIWVPPAC